MQQKLKPVKINTPIGTAKFPRLQEPDTRFDDLGVYSVNLLLPKDDPKTERLISRIAEIYEDFRATLPTPKNKKEPESFGYADDYDENGNETGYVVFKFKSKASYIDASGAKKELKAPALFDAKLKPIPNEIAVWGGSTMIVNFSPIPYFQGKNCGVTLRLNACQVIELQSGNGDSAASYGFGETDGYSVAASQPSNPFDNADDDERADF